MFRDELRTLWAEPRAPEAPARVPGDWLLLGAGLIATALEASFRAEVTWRPLSIIVTVGLYLLVLWRRTHPLAMVVIAFGGGVLLTLMDVLTGHTQEIGLRSGIVVLVLFYALTRWGSGREIVLGSAVVLASFTFSSIHQGGPAGDILGGLSFLMFPAALGGFIRLRAMSRRRELEEMRARERESIARELHDTVAHHVSAIVVRAQAGRVLADLDPSTAAETLAGVEEEGARTLEAMRAMVKALRTADADAELTPLPGAADLRRLAIDRPGDGAGGIPIDLRIDGPTETLPPAVDAAIFRIVQESVTNATRHATGATAIEVRVITVPGMVRVTVRDDGTVTSRGSRRKGYGLPGLRERAAMLGGDLRAGPCPGGGWLVEAELPLSGGKRRSPGPKGLPPPAALDRPLGAAGNRPLRSASDPPLGAAGDRPLGNASDPPLGAARDRPLGSALDRPLGAVGDRLLSADGDRPLGAATGDRPPGGGEGGLVGGGDGGALSDGAGGSAGDGRGHSDEGVEGSVHPRAHR